MNRIAQSELTPLHLRNVTDLIVQKIPGYDQLNGDPASRDAKYLSALTDRLKTSVLKPTKYFGASLVIVKPETKGKELPVAVKIHNPDAIGFKMAKYFMGAADPDTLLKIARKKGYFRLFNKLDISDLSDLSEDEKTFLFFALEHAMYEQLYQPYVLPAVFTSYVTENDISHRYITINKGGIVYAMIQNFEDLVPLYSAEGVVHLDEKQRAQLADFKQKILRVEEETGYFPDETMFSSGSSNLCFTKDGRLILIDTNILKNTKISDRSKFEALLHDLDWLLNST